MTHWVGTGGGGLRSAREWPELAVLDDTGVSELVAAGRVVEELERARARRCMRPSNPRKSGIGSRVASGYEVEIDPARGRPRTSAHVGLDRAAGLERGAGQQLAELIEASANSHWGGVGRRRSTRAPGGARGSRSISVASIGDRSDNATVEEAR